MADYCKNPDALDRRDFIGRIAFLSGIAPLVSNPLSSRNVPGQTQIASVKKVLTAADFTYLGAMRVPRDGADLTFSYGAITGRKVNGNLRLFLTQSIIGNYVPIHGVAEIADTQDY